MADGAVSFLLDKLSTILIQKASMLGNAYGEIEGIKLELESMRSFLKDAELRKEQNESVDTWVKQVREVSYRVEDIIDEFMHFKELWQHEEGCKTCAQDIADLFCYINAKHRISAKLKDIKAKIHAVAERSKRYAFDDTVGEGRSSVSPDWWQHGGASLVFIDEDEIVGMRDDKEILLGWLIEANMRRTIISIVGMGGLGKTTLVTKVYNDQVIQKHFDCWAWISVSQSYSIENLLQGMVKEFFKTEQQMIPGNLGVMNWRQLVEILINYLHDKKYVVVLDDVWSIPLWSMIRGAFPDNKLGSRIIFTTRNENVAISVGPGSRIYHLKPLQENDAWDLFCRKAFWSLPDRRCPIEMEEPAQAIMRKCEGLPLAIVAIGGLLCSRSKTAVEWKKVYDSLNWQLSNNPMLERVKGILLLSFGDLPFYLKHCFLYCCVFCDGYPIPRKKLIRLWIAEGFITERKGMTMEEVAEDYLTELIFRSMIQVTETNEAGRVKRLKVHDVMHELAMTTSEKECFSVTYDRQCSKLEGKIQHLSVYNRGENIRVSRTLLRHLRSFFVFQTDNCSSFCLGAVSSKFKLLRVLDLQGVFVEKIPATLLRLFNLRYLNLRGTRVQTLPKAVGMLKNLQTLDLRDTNVANLPRKVSNMQNLRHLFLRGNSNHRSETSNLVSGVRVPAEICNIRSLQTLACVQAEEELIQLLGNLTDLKRLDMANLKVNQGPKLCDSIQKMTNLRRLSLVACRLEQDLKLDDLSRPPSYLQKLTLVGQMNKLPHWFGYLAHLTHLYLAFSCLENDILSSLQGLPMLVLLQLQRAWRGRVMEFKAGGFQKLSKLSFLDLVELDSVRVEEGALPCIKELYLVRCQGLKLLPEGVEHLAGLQKLHLEEMPEELVQRLRSGEDEPKVKHIPIISHRDQSDLVETLS